MKDLSIEWRHYQHEGATCDRCAATGLSVREVVSELGRELAQRGVSITFTETILPEELMAQSNMILLSGVPLENVLDDAAADENPCPSCSCLTGSETSCRTVRYQGTTYEKIPQELIRKALYKVILKPPTPGSWLLAPGSWLLAPGSWLLAPDFLQLPTTSYNFLPTSSNFFQFLPTPPLP